MEREREREREREGMRKREGRERKEREKMREREREIVGLNGLRVLKKKKKIYPIQLQYHLTFEMVL